MTAISWTFLRTLFQNENLLRTKLLGRPKQLCLGRPGNFGQWASYIKQFKLVVTLLLEAKYFVNVQRLGFLTTRHWGRNWYWTTNCLLSTKHLWGEILHSSFKVLMCQKRRRLGCAIPCPGCLWLLGRAHALQISLYCFNVHLLRVFDENSDLTIVGHEYDLEREMYIIHLGEDLVEGVFYHVTMG